jgi:hypothetical protein
VGFGYSSIAPSNTGIAQTVWSYGPRTLTDIQSLVNAIQNNDPSLLSTLGDLPFIPAPMYAGQVSLTQVASFISNLVQNYNAAGVIASFINSNPYSLWHMDFVTNLIQSPYLGFTNASQILSAASTSALASIAVSTNVSATTLLQLITNAWLAATAAQALLRGLAENYYYNKLIYTITANATSITFSTNATISTSPLIAQSITIASGVTVACGLGTCYFVAQTFNNQGVVVNTNGASAGGGGNGGGGGGGPGGGIAILAITAAVGTINVNGYNGEAGYTSFVTGDGGAPGYAVDYFVTVSGVGIPWGGVGGGPLQSTYSANAKANGGGGGDTLCCYGGVAAGSLANVYSFPDYQSLVTYMMESVADWWLSNIVGKSPPQTASILSFYGGGGGAGGGAAYTGYAGGGGGGGGAGEAIIYGYSVEAGTINAYGGNGGNGVVNSTSGGGGGGGGGLVFVIYGPGGLSGTMNVNVAGGLPGTGAAQYVAAQPGGTGVYIATSVTVNG